MKRKTWAPLLAAVGGALVVLLAIVVAMQLSSSKSHSADSKNLHSVSAINESLRGIPQHDNLLGNPKAKVTIVEYGDPQCPYCGMFSTQILPLVIKRYVRPGLVRIDFVGQTGFGTDSVRIFKLAAAAGRQGKFWNVLELAYANQGPETNGDATDAYLKSIAGAVPGLNAAKTFTDSQTNAFDGLMNANTAAFNSHQYKYLPTFEIGPTGKAPTKTFDGVPTAQEFLGYVKTALAAA